MAIARQSPAFGALSNHEGRFATVTKITKRFVFFVFCRQAFVVIKASIYAAFPLGTVTDESPTMPFFTAN